MTSADDLKIENAKNVANTWLSLVDQENYSESWHHAANYFKNAVSEDQWKQSMNAFRKPLGKNQTRKILSATYSKTLPGAPDGEYVVIQYTSSFENKATAIETVTPMLDKDSVEGIRVLYQVNMVYF